MTLEAMKEQLANLLRNKRRAKRNKDHNFQRIASEYKTLKAKIQRIENP